MVVHTNNRYLAFVEARPYEDPKWEGAVTVCFGQASRGWALLWVSCTAFLQSITIYTSYAVDPYRELVRWLEDLAEDRLPAEFTIDEEGKAKTLRATPYGEDGLLDFQIREGYVREEEAEIFFRVRVEKRQLISEFVRKLDLFIQEYYRRDQWKLGFDLREMDLSKLRKYMRLQETQDCLNKKQSNFLEER